MKKWFTIVYIVCLLLTCYPAQAATATTVTNTENDAVIGEQLDMLNLTSFQNVVDELSARNTAIERFDIKQTAVDIITGRYELSVKNILGTLVTIFFAELKEILYLIRSIIVICLLSAVLQNITASFATKSVSDLGYYTLYIALVILLFKAFNTGIHIVSGTINELVTIMQATLPLIATFFAISGQVFSNMVFMPVLVTGIHVITLFIRDILLPVTTFAAMLHIINYIAKENILDKLAGLLRNGISLSLKGIALLFMAILSLQKLGAPVLDTVINKSARVAVSAVPVVGGVLSGSVDNIFSLFNAVKSGTTAAVILFAVLACLVPVMKLLALAVSFKVVAAIVEPVCEERLSLCIDEIGSYTALLLGIIITVLTMFIFMLLIILSAAKVV